MRGAVLVLAALTLAASALAADDVAGSVAAIRGACAGDVRCAERLARARFGNAAVVRVAHPDTDTIRWVQTRASVTVVREFEGARLVRLDRFGRRPEKELRAALDGMAADEALIVDLRANGGGGLARMLEAAGVLLGPVPEAVALIGEGATTMLDVPGGEPFASGRLTVLVGPHTASSAEVLAALLRHHGGARLLGERTRGKDRVMRLVPLHHDLRVLVEAGRIEVPGATIQGGLVPDGPLPAELR